MTIERLAVAGYALTHVATHCQLLGKLQSVQKTHKYAASHSKQRLKNKREHVLSSKIELYGIIA